MCLSFYKDCPQFYDNKLFNYTLFWRSGHHWLCDLAYAAKRNSVDNAWIITGKWKQPQSLFSASQTHQITNKCLKNTR